MSVTYAAATNVSVDRSKTDIERILRRYGADSFAFGWDKDKAMIGFTMRGRQIRFTLPMPDAKSIMFTRTDSGRQRSPAAIETAYEQAVRSRWRALMLVIKAKLEAVNSGIVTFEDEWSMFTVLPDGVTVRDYVTPAIDEAYRTGHIPPLVPGMSPRALEAGRSHDG